MARFAHHSAASTELYGLNLPCLLLALTCKNLKDNKPLDQAPGRTQFIPVIRAGDLLVIEESTTVADARLEAVALGPATAGSPLNVRLKIGGKVVRAIALSPGRAAFAREEVER